MQFVLTGISDESTRLIQLLVNDDERIREQSAIDNIVEQMRGVEDKDNPLIAVGKLVCVEVANELVKRLAVLTNVDMAMEQAIKKIVGQVPLKDELPVAVRWRGEPLNLSPEKANGLYMLAQEVGKKIAKKMKEQDFKDNIQRFSSLKQHCKPGSEIADAIDGFYERIAKKVAIKMAERLVFRMRKFPEALYSAEKSEQRSRETRILVPHRKSVHRTDKGVTIASPADPLNARIPTH